MDSLLYKDQTRAPLLSGPQHTMSDLRCQALQGKTSPVALFSFGVAFTKSVVNFVPLF